MTDQEIITLVYDDLKLMTPQAYLVIFGDEKAWLPKTLTKIDESSNTLEIPLWLAIKKELEGYEE